jgi:hypothetical protein
MMKPNNFDPIAVRTSGIIQQQRPAPAEVAAEYSDAELYRIVVAQALTNGTVSTKAEFDSIVRTLGNVGGADELIAFRKLRPGCHAWRHGKSMVCECGVTWQVDDTNPPHCKVMP